MQSSLWLKPLRQLSDPGRPKALPANSHLVLVRADHDVVARVQLPWMLDDPVTETGRFNSRRAANALVSKPLRGPGTARAAPMSATVSRVALGEGLISNSQPVEEQVLKA